MPFVLVSILLSSSLGLVSELNAHHLHHAVDWEQTGGWKVGRREKEIE